MTDKQIKTLILFAQNYSLKRIAKKQKISLSSIRQRIKSLSNNYPNEFERAVGIRRAYKNAFSNVNKPISMENVNPADITKKF